MIQTKTKVIDGDSYEVSTLPATRGMKMLTQLVKMVGPSVGALAGEKSDSKSILDLDVGGKELSMAISYLTERLDDERVNDIIKQLAAHTHVNNKPLADSFDLHFSGKLGTMFQWLGFALEVQYGDFLSVLISKSKGVMAMMNQAPLSSPNT